MHPEAVQTGVVGVAVVGQHPQADDLKRLVGLLLRVVLHGERLSGRRTNRVVVHAP